MWNPKLQPWLLSALVACSASGNEGTGDSDGSSSTTATTEDTLPTLSSSGGSSGSADASGTTTTGEDTDGDLPPDAGRREVFVHLFEWPWESVALECEAFLGPAGYAAVQVSPPQEYPAGVQGSPWWDRYQPVSYEIIGRSGDRDAFVDMVQRCAAVGVDIYVDAVINHMAWSHQGVGVGGTQFDEYDYPPTYEDRHFHDCRQSIQDYEDRDEVQTCELFGLPDLDTSQVEVQNAIASYLSELIDIGVGGFRIDAAKHIAADELAAILDGLPGEAVIFSEVIADDTIGADEYVELGRVTEFAYGRDVSDVVRAGTLADLAEVGESPGFIPGERAVVFIDNHDNQRGHGNGEGVLTHRSPTAYRLAHAFMLAWPYGYPKVMSSYAFDDDDARPPTMPNGATVAVHDAQGDCASPWVCEHRWPEIAAMVRLRNLCHDAPLSELWTGDPNAIAFAREECGFVAMNAGATPIDVQLSTTLPAGEYCDRLSQGGCAQSITVDADGVASFQVPADSAVALHTGD